MKPASKMFISPLRPPPAPPSSTIPGLSGITSATSGSFTLDEEQKRWLVVGICLHKVLLPPLRSYLEPEINRHYTNLKTNHNIDKQTFSKHLPKDATFTLNYGSINNNEANHRKVAKKYDYDVKSEVDLTKLYLKPYMAMFSGFDDTCDLSAVLGIIASASIFTTNVQKFASDVRQDIRNVWGHCNFTEWTEIKFAKSFQLMDSFLRSISLTPAEEKKLINELSDWETKGMDLCLGHIVDADLVKLIEQEVSQLSNQVQIMETYQQDEAKRVGEALNVVNHAIEKFKEDISQRVESLEKSQKTLKQEVDEMSEGLGIVQTDHERLKKKVASSVSSLEEKHSELDRRVKTLEVSIESKSATVIDTFLAPNRIPSFYGRSLELTSLDQCLEDKTTPCIISAICGLGGTGKTSLAIEHVWKNKQLYKGGVFWLSGESVSHFQNTISEMARELGTFDEDFKKMLSGTLDWLKKRRDLWCIVIDNLDEYDLNDEMLKFFNGHWKRNATGHMLITTRREIKKIQNDIPEALNEHCIELGTFSEEESSQFLKQRSNQVVGEYNGEKTLKELSLMLGYLPLALDQAAAYIKYTGVQFSEYLKLFKKQKLDTLKRFKAHYPAQDTSKERVAVHTTWKLNFEYVHRLSEEYGIGQAASLVMNVSAFLSPDDIPLEIINKGLPEVEQEDLHNCLSFQTGVADIVSVLTNFSLFLRFTDNSVSVHRLVQEVIRNNVSEDGKTKVVLQSASRMLHRAFTDTNSPRSICQSFQGDSVFNHKNPPSLYLWGKLSSHANVLQGHLIDACNLDDSLRQDLINTEETAFLVNEVSLYLSVCRQKVQAMELQKAKLKILTTLDMSQEKLSDFQYFDIPLKNFEFKLISHCMKSQEQSQTSPGKLVNEGNDCQAKADEWREQGNSAFKSQDYQQALNCYNVAFKWNSNDCRVLTNRALCLLKMDEAVKALEDCEKCLEIEKHNKKALKRKAWALFEISKSNTNLRERAEGAAVFAAHVDPLALKETVFTKMFPDLRNKIEISNPTQLTSLLYLEVGTTFLLHNGYYDLQGVLIKRNVRFVAIDGEVSMKFGELAHVLGCNLCAEGIRFPRGCKGIKCHSGGSVTMFKCHISSGKKSCEKFPECNGEDGCIAGLVPGRQRCDRRGKFGEAFPSGVVGFPAITMSEHCTGFFENCEIEECGGGGILCHGKGSRMYVKGCKVHHNHQSGLEAREGGRLEAIDNDIYSNGLHGILLGPSASASKIVQNRIYENSKEGVAVVKSMTEEMKIVRNQIHHNHALGISLDTCQVLIKQNDIFENGFYGIHAKNLTTVLVENNDIYSNKCGGIHMGMNFSGRVTIASNTIRNHSGPWLSKPDRSTEISLSETMLDIVKDNPAFFLPEGGTRFYSNPPILKNNVIKKLEEGIFHPKKTVELLSNECGYCHETQMLSKCSRCNIASYCSVSCQEKHWDKHEILCSSVSEKYFVIVDFNKNPSGMRVFGSHLKGIGTGAKPDPKSKRRFVVKIQTNQLNCHPLQMLSLYDRSTSVDGQIQSPEVFHIIMECGVLGKMAEFTSKKAFFYTTFVDRNPMKLKINLAELADYQDW